MRGLVEAAVFLGLAAGVHLVVVANLAGEPGARGSGDRGEALTSLEAAPESFAALARSWREGPDAVAPAAVLEPTETARERSPQARVASPPDAPEPHRAPAPPDAPRGERDLPAAGPQVPTAAQTAPDGSPTGAAMSADAVARDGPSAALGASIAQAAPQAPEAPKGDAGPTGAAPPPQPTAQVKPAGEVQRRPQPRPDSATTQRHPQDSPPRPAADPAPDSAPQPAQQARGAGEGSAAGARQDSPSAALSDAERRSALASWGGAIRARIEQHKRYPAEARNRRLSGTTTVRMEVASDGRLLTVGVSAGSGHEVLDRAALDAVRDAGRFSAAPQELREASVQFELPVSFRP